MATINPGKQTPENSSTPYPAIPPKSTPSTPSIPHTVMQWARRAVCGPAPAGLKAAFGAATRSCGALTPGPLRALKSGAAVRPVACPAQRPPRPTTTTTGHPRRPDRGGTRVDDGTRFTRSEASRPTTAVELSAPCRGPLSGPGRAVGVPVRGWSS